MFEKSLDGFLWMEAFTNFEKAPDLTKRGYRLDRMELLLKCFGDPQNHGSAIHIAGSKGKGSTAAFTASILTESGFRTGFYSSPHISDYRERITVDGEFAPEEVYVKNMNLIRNLIEGEQYLSLPGGSEPTTFELLTLLAFLVFREMDCRWIVLETGLGGRLDATNLVHPRLVLLTPIELEHTDLLGDTLELIASEKAGIIKQGVPVISSSQKEEALQVFIKRAAEKNATFSYLPELMEKIKCETGLEGSDLEIQWKKGRHTLSRLKLRGEHQGENCALAVAGIHNVLPEIPDDQINRAVSGTFLPGRMELIRENPPVMIDGAHTKQSIERTLKTFSQLFTGKGILIYGSVAGKDAQSMASILSGHFEHIIISRPGTFKKSNPRELFTLFQEKNESTFLLEEPDDAWEKALELSRGEKPVLVAGSFYMAAEIRKILKKQGRKK